MASVSIQGRVNGCLWKSLKRENETNTQLLQRLTDHYQATSGDQLNTIAATPQGAIAVLLHEHEQLQQLLQKAVLVLPSTTVAVPTETETADTKPARFDDDF